MPYELKFAATAFKDIRALVASLPPEHQTRAVEEINSVCVAFVGHPPFAAGKWAVPTFPLHFKIDDTHYYWAASFWISQDEAAVVVTHVFRVPL